MAIPETLYEYLSRHGVSYDVIPHQKTNCSRMNARNECSRSIRYKSRGRQAQEGFVLAVVPASREVALRRLGELFAHPVCLATEQELHGLFMDCEVGAIPPLGQAYGIRTVVDRQLLDQDDIYFEGGDHRSVVHLKGGSFRRLMDKVPHRAISREPRSDSAPGHLGDLCYWGA